jgi:hypothetical protein
MNAIQILEAILGTLPAGLNLTHELLAFIQTLDTAFSTGQIPAEHQTAVVHALGEHLAMAAVAPTPDQADDSQPDLVGYCAVWGT